MNECRTEGILIECDCFKHPLSNNVEGDKQWAKQLKETLQVAEVVSLNQDNAEALGFDENHWYEVLGKNKWLYGLQRRTRKGRIDNVQINLVQEIQRIRTNQEIAELMPSKVETIGEGVSLEQSRKESQGVETLVEEAGQMDYSEETHYDVVNGENEFNASNEDFLAAESLQNLNQEVHNSAQFEFCSQETEDAESKVNGSQEINKFTEDQEAHPVLISQSEDIEHSQSQNYHETALEGASGTENESFEKNSIPVKIMEGVPEGVIFGEEVEIHTSREEDLSGTSLTLKATRTGEDGNITITNIHGAENSAEGIKVALSSIGVCGDKEMINLDAVVIEHVQPSSESDPTQNPAQQTVVVPLNADVPVSADTPEGTVSLARFLEDLFQNQRVLDGRQYAKTEGSVVVLQQPDDASASIEDVKSMSSIAAEDIQNKLHKLQSGNFYICEICGKVIARRYMKSHTKAHESNTDPSPYARKKWKCDICNKMLISDKKVHMRRHSGEKPYSCRYCDETFVATSERYFHEKRKHTKDYQYQCEICQRKFLKKVTLLRHHEAHKRGTANCKKIKPSRDRKKYQQQTYEKRKSQIGACKVCGKKLPRTSLYEHQRRHLNLRPFQCSFCPSSFTTKGNLQDHMNIHTGNTPYKCKFCDKSYTRRYSLIVHERSHTGERPYSCAVCNKGWRESYGYKLHMQKHHPELVDTSVRVRPRKRETSSSLCVEVSSVIGFDCIK